MLFKICGCWAKPDVKSTTAVTTSFAPDSVAKGSHAAQSYSLDLNPETLANPTSSRLDNDVAAGASGATTSDSSRGPGPNPNESVMRVVSLLQELLAMSSERRKIPVSRMMALLCARCPVAWASLTAVSHSGQYYQQQGAAFSLESGRPQMSFTMPGRSSAPVASILSSTNSLKRTPSRQSSSASVTTGVIEVGCRDAIPVVGSGSSVELVIASGKPLAITLSDGDDASLLASLPADWQKLHHERGLRSMLCLPVLASNATSTLTGCLSLGALEECSWSQQWWYPSIQLITGWAAGALAQSDATGRVNLFEQLLTAATLDGLAAACVAGLPGCLCDEPKGKVEARLALVSSKLSRAIIFAQTVDPAASASGGSTTGGARGLIGTDGELVLLPGGSESSGRRHSLSVTSGSSRLSMTPAAAAAAAVAAGTAAEDAGGADVAGGMELERHSISTDSTLLLSVLEAGDVMTIKDALAYFGRDHMVAKDLALDGRLALGGTLVLLPLIHKCRALGCLYIFVRCDLNMLLPWHSCAEMSELLSRVVFTKLVGDLRLEWYSLLSDNQPLLLQQQQQQQQQAAQAAVQVSCSAPDAAGAAAGAALVDPSGVAMEPDPEMVSPKPTALAAGDMCSWRSTESTGGPATAYRLLGLMQASASGTSSTLNAAEPGAASGLAGGPDAAGPQSSGPCGQRPGSRTLQGPAGALGAEQLGVSIHLGTAWRPPSGSTIFGLDDPAMLTNNDWAVRPLDQGAIEGDAEVDAPGCSGSGSGLGSLLDLQGWPELIEVTGELHKTRNMSLYSATFRGRAVAVKVMRYAGSIDGRSTSPEQHCALLLRLTQIRHPNLVQVLCVYPTVYEVVLPGRGGDAPHVFLTGVQPHREKHRRCVALLMEHVPSFSLREAINKRLMFMSGGGEVPCCSSSRQPAATSAPAAPAPAAGTEGQGGGAGGSGDVPNMPLITAILVQVARSLARLHQAGMIHGELRAENVLCCRELHASGSSGSQSMHGILAAAHHASLQPEALSPATVVKVKDPGMCSITISKGQLLVRKLVNRPRALLVPFLAPEIFHGERPTKACDAYSFGLLMWELYTGAVAYSNFASTPTKLIQTVISDGLRPKFPTSAPAWYSGLAMRCWQPHVRQRPSFRKILAVLAEEAGSGEAATAVAPLPTAAALPSEGAAMEMGATTSRQQ